MRLQGLVTSANHREIENQGKRIKVIDVVLLDTDTKDICYNYTVWENDVTAGKVPREISFGDKLIILVNDITEDRGKKLRVRGSIFKYEGFKGDKNAINGLV